MIKQPVLRVGASIFARRQAGCLFEGIGKIVRIAVADTVADLCGRMIRLAELRPGVIHFCLYDKLLDGAAGPFPEQCGKIFFVVSEIIGNFRDPEIFAHMPVDIVGDILKKLLRAVLCIFCREPCCAEVGAIRRYSPVRTVYPTGPSAMYRVPFVTTISSKPDSRPDNCRQYIAWESTKWQGAGGRQKEGWGMGRKKRRAAYLDGPADTAAGSMRTSCRRTG